MFEFLAIILVWTVCIGMETRDKRAGRYPREWN